MARAQAIVGPRYLARFQCLGGECDDHCCGPWAITVDQQHYARLRRAIDGDPAARARLSDALELVDPLHRTSSAYACMRHDDAGRCAMLDGERLCTIHRRFGEELLPDTCALFPRSLLRIGDRVEITATLSCPEIARLALASDDALDLVELDAAALPPALRKWLPAALGASQGEAAAPFPSIGRTRDPYIARLREVRSVVDHVLAAPGYRVSTRLYALALLGDVTHGYFHRAAAPASDALLGRELGTLVEPDTLPMIERSLAAGAATDPGAAALVHQLLDELSRQPGAARFAALAATVPRRPPAAMADRRTCPRRIDDPTPVVARRIDRHIERYLRNAWRRETYLSWPHLLACAANLALRHALIRVLVLAHPAVIGCADDDASIAGPANPIDRVAVEVLYQVARRLEHLRDIAALLDERLAAAGLATLDGCRSLLQL